MPRTTKQVEIAVPRDLVTLKDLQAKGWPASRHRVNWLREEGRLRIFKIGRRVLISESEFLSLIAQEEKPPRGSL